MKLEYGDMPFDKFVDILVKEYETNNLSIVCDYDLAKRIVKSMTTWKYDIDLYDITLVSPEIDGNDGTYFIATVDNQLFVEQARSKEGSATVIESFEDDVIFVADNMAQDIIDAIKGMKIFFTIAE